MKLTECFFVSDLHGRIERYEKLFKRIAGEKPRAVFLGGDLLPLDWSQAFSPERDFVDSYLAAEFKALKGELGENYPRVFIIMGNDDARVKEDSFIRAADQGIWDYAHKRKFVFSKYMVYGYANVPPTPFQLKDWERYDVSRYVDPGCVSPERGKLTVPVDQNELKYCTIKKDLEKLTDKDDLGSAVFLFHSPPHQTRLDRAALDGKYIDGVPLDPHVGSIAIRRFIEAGQPLLTLHGHIHESARLTGGWSERIGRTWMYSAAHDGKELALIRFDLENPGNANRELI